MYHHDLSKVNKLTKQQRAFFDILVDVYGPWDSVLKPQGLVWRSVIQDLRGALAIYLTLRARGYATKAATYGRSNRNTIMADLSLINVASPMLHQSDTELQRRGFRHPLIEKLGLYDGS